MRCARRLPTQDRSLDAPLVPHCRLSYRTAAALTALSLIPALTTFEALTAPPDAAAAPAPGPAPAGGTLLRSADGVHRATITRTRHGIPHIVADDYESLGFGHGFATAETSICTLADTLMTARGERSRWLGPKKRYSDQVTLFATNLQTDTLQGPDSTVQPAAVGALPVDEPPDPPGPDSEVRRHRRSLSLRPAAWLITAEKL